MTAMVPDPVAVHNERTKLLANFLNALAVGLVGIGVLAPLVAFAGQVAGAAPVGATLRIVPVLGLAASWPILGMVFHGTAHYVLRRLNKAAPDERA